MECTICTNGVPASEPIETGDPGLYIALCTGCKDWGEFENEEEIEEENDL